MAQGVLDNKFHRCTLYPYPWEGFTPLFISPRGAFSPCLDLVGPPGTPQNSTLKNSPQTIGPKNRPGTRKVTKSTPKAVRNGAPDALRSDFFYFFENLDFVQPYNGFAMFLPSRGVAGATFLTKKRVLELGCAFDTSKINFFRFVYRKCLKMDRPGVRVSPA